MADEPKKDEQAQTTTQQPAEPAKTEEKKEEKPSQPEVKTSEPKTKEVKVSKKLEGIIKEIEILTVLELADLVKALEQKFGVAAVAAAPVAAASNAAAGGKAPVEEKSSYNVVLKTDGGQKIQVLKAVRELVPTLTLIDAKKLVESLPKEVLTGVKKEEAEEAKKKLEAAGGQVELK